MRRTALLILCVFGLAVAGCSGPSDSGPQSTVTPVDRPAIPTETSDGPLEDVTRQTIETPTPAPTARPNATFQGVEMPPGTDERGIVNVETLLDANRGALGTTAFTATRNRTVHVWNDGQRQEVEIDAARFSVGTAGRAVYRTWDIQRSDEATHNYTVQGYVANETRYIQRLSSNTSYYRLSSSVDDLRRSLSGPRLWVPFSDREWDPVGTTTVHGQAAVVFEWHRNATEGETGTGRAVIDTRGLVHSVHMQRETSLREQRYDITTSHEVEPKSNVTIEEPSWLDDAKNATSESNTTPSG